MSVFLVNPTTEEEEEDNPTEEGSNAITINVEDNPRCNVAALNQFWPKVIEDIRKIGTLDLKTQALPLARIKKVMKLDDNVKMISAEAPMLFSKAAEIFINELTLRAWIHTEDNRRRTLQRNDIAMAITKYDQFDFLIDIVPREEAKIVTKGVNDIKTTLNPDQVQYYFQLAQQQQQQQQTNNATASSTGQTIQILQPVTSQVVALGNGSQDQISNNTSNITTSTSTTVTGSQQAQVIQLQGNTQTLNANSSGVLQFVQQVITPTGEIQHIPIQLNSNQMQMLRMQVQNSPQTQQVQVVQSQPQIIQVAPQANGPSPVYISQPTVNPTTSPE
ncbi:nuclear transcription factor Y subunit gamma-like isoform X2 [Sipha flava]|uniref:Nuclear transcription factor Y subunit gamma n=1 Tax=Sipha flava TaxID=143950 RepID=A0A8B8GR86_9HEMI|nr:nuclear transcription factor Y subunit gamma-like isoform X2 [Sipha flava]